MSQPPPPPLSIKSVTLPGLQKPTIIQIFILKLTFDWRTFYPDTSSNIARGISNVLINLYYVQLTGFCYNSSSSTVCPLLNQLGICKQWVQKQIFRQSFLYMTDHAGPQRFHTFPPLMKLICYAKTSPRAKTIPRAPKLGYKGGRASQLSARETLSTSGADVVFEFLHLP